MLTSYSLLCIVSKNNDDNMSLDDWHESMTSAFYAMLDFIEGMCNDGFPLTETQT